MLNRYNNVIVYHIEVMTKNGRSIDYGYTVGKNSGDGIEVEGTWAEVKEGLEGQMKQLSKRIKGLKVTGISANVISMAEYKMLEGMGHFGKKEDVVN